jgi:hypothetical protein
MAYLETTIFVAAFMEEYVIDPRKLALRTISVSAIPAEMTAIFFTNPSQIRGKKALMG